MVATVETHEADLQWIRRRVSELEVCCEAYELGRDKPSSLLATAARKCLRDAALKLEAAVVEDRGG